MRLESHKKQMKMMSKSESEHTNIENIVYMLLIDDILRLIKFMTCQ